MWPFDDPKNQIAAHLNVQKIGPEPQGNKQDIKIKELEQRLFGLECAIIEVCQAIQISQANNNQNFMMVEKSFLNLVQYVMKPRSSIMGDGQEKN
jgi:hypothetical protein